MEDWIGQYTSPLGPITVSGSGEAVTGLWFEGQKYFGATLPKEFCRDDTPIWKRTRDWLDRYFRGEQPAFSVPVCPRGTPFQLTVWEILRRIPYGQVCSYGDIAKEIARQRGLSFVSARAVGNAVGHNPVSILIPCHRVVGSDGSLTGYAGGIDRKVQLLSLEGIPVSGGKVSLAGGACGGWGAIHSGSISSP